MGKRIRDGGYCCRCLHFPEAFIAHKEECSVIADGGGSAVDRWNAAIGGHLPGHNANPQSHIYRDCSCRTHHDSFTNLSLESLFVYANRIFSGPAGPPDDIGTGLPLRRFLIFSISLIDVIGVVVYGTPGRREPIQKDDRDSAVISGELLLQFKAAFAATRLPTPDRAERALDAR